MCIQNKILRYVQSHLKHEMVVTNNYLGKYTQLHKLKYMSKINRRNSK